MNIYEYSQASLELLDMLTAADAEDMTEEDMMQVINDTLEAMGLNEKLDNYGKFIREMEADAEKLKAEEKRIADHRRYLENKVDMLKRNLVMFLDTTVDGKAQTDLFRFSCRSTESVEIDNIESISAEFCKITRTADKTKIKNAIKNGEMVDGAKLITNRSVTIK